MPPDGLKQLGKNFGRNKRDTNYFYNRVGYLPQVDRTRGPMTDNFSPCGQTGPHIAPFNINQNHRKISLSLAFYKPFPCPSCILLEAVPDALGGMMQVVPESRFAPPFDIIDPGEPTAYLYIPASSPVTPTETFVQNASFQPTVFTGTPNGGNTWGLSSTVNNDGDIIQARWEFASAPVKVCAITIQSFGSITDPTPTYDGSPLTPPEGRTDSVYGLSILANGSIVVTPDQVFANILPQTNDSLSYNPINGITGSSWGLEYKASLGMGGFDGFHFFGGLTLVSFAVWTAAPEG